MNAQVDRTHMPQRSVDLPERCIDGQHRATVARGTQGNAAVLLRALKQLGPFADVESNSILKGGAPA
jgi:hypothetical protein